MNWSAPGARWNQYPFPHPAHPGETFLSDVGVSYLLAPETDPSLAYGCPPRYQSVRQMLTYEFRMITHHVKTASGALQFYHEVLVLYYQVDRSIAYDDRYSRAYRFALDVIPQYLSGGEAERYIQEQILPLFPDTMKKSERKKAIRNRIREEFRSEKGVPHWVQSADWPFGADGKPTTYIGKGASGEEVQRWRFRDESTGEVIVVEQYD